MTRDPVTRHADTLPRDASVRARVIAALRDGRATARALGPRRPPHPPNSPLAVERAISLAWCRGYSAGNPVVLDTDN